MGRDTLSVSEDATEPSTRARILIALAIGLACGIISWLAANKVVGFDQDFAASIRATWSVLRHGDPYASRVPPGNGLSGTPFFYYPLPMALLLVPLASIPVKIGGPIFAGITSAILAFAVTRNAWWPLIIFSSASALISIAAANMSLLMTAGVLLPALAWVGVFKPNIGLAILAYRPSWKAAVIMLAIAAASLLAMPDWPQRWIANAANSRFHFAPWRVPVGILIIPLALTKWRRPEARILAMLAAVPSSPIIYEALPLFTIPRSRREMVILSALSHAAFLVNARHSLLVDPDAFVAVGRASMVILLYAPALMFVMRRPNVGRVPIWLESASAKLPMWLRGHESDALNLASH